MIALVWLQGDSLDGSELLLLELFDFLSINDLRGLGRVDAAGLDRNNELTSVLDEHCSVDTQNTGLIRLSDVSEDDIAHRNEHSVLLGVSSVLNNRNNVGSLLGHVDEVSARSLREFDCINCAFLFNNIKINIRFLMSATSSRRHSLTGPTRSAT